MAITQGLFFAWLSCSGGDLDSTLKLLVLIINGFVLQFGRGNIMKLV